MGTTKSWVSNSGRVIATAAAIAALCLAMAPLTRAQQTARAKEIGHKLLCVCGCNQILTECNHIGCSYSHAMLKEVDERVARNESESLTLQAFVQEYGESVLASPPAKGFNLWAWIMPVVFVLIGLFLLRLVVLRWRYRAATAKAAQVSPEMLARARRESGGESE